MEHRGYAAPTELTSDFERIAIKIELLRSTVFARQILKPNCLTINVERLCVRMNSYRRRVWVRFPKESGTKTAATRPKTDLRTN